MKPETRFELAGYEVHLRPAANTVASPQRTESLARELVRGLLGAGAAPVLRYGETRRELSPPDSKLVIGRGDEADWVILDEDLSREHAEVRRGWDGVTIRDLDSKNGTIVDGTRIAGPVELHDGARIELGNVVIEFCDPAERELTTSRSRTNQDKKNGDRPHSFAPASTITFAVALAIAGLATAGLAWILFA